MLSGSPVLRSNENFIVRSLLSKLLHESLGTERVHIRELCGLVAVEHQFFADASLGAASGDCEGIIGVLTYNDVGVIDVDSQPLIGADGNVLVPCVYREVGIDEKVFGLSEAKTVEAGLPVFALVGGAQIYGLLAGLLQEEDTAGAVVLGEGFVAARGFGEAVYQAAAGDWVNVVVAVNFSAWIFLGVVIGAFHASVFVVVLVVECDTGTDAGDVALHVL